MEENEKITEEKLHEEIAELMNRIKNTEYDLANMFKGNGLIQQKLVNSKKSLEDKKKALKELQESKPKLKEKEQEITEAAISEVSKEQEALIEEEIEEQLV